MQVQLFKIAADGDQMVYDQNSLNDFLSEVGFVKSDTHFVESEIPYWSVLLHFENMPQAESRQEKGKPLISPEADLDESQQQLFLVLKDWRNATAGELGLSAFLVSYNRELAEIAIRKPNDLEALKAIKGFGAVKTERYGSAILEIVKGFENNEVS